MGRLVGLELKDFKSYKGTASIGFGSANFTSIIGPNGSGKSNMMDAISFVLGVRSSHLRSTQLKDLIYRGRVDSDDGTAEDDPDSAYVMAIYEKDDGDVMKLKREISPSGSSEYLINGQPVSASQYADVLQEESILIKAKNFLVFQGDVEKIAGQSPSELTSLVETVSGSLEFKKDYDRLNAEKEKAHDETALRNTKRRALKDELRQYKNQCREVEEYDDKTARLDTLMQYKYLVQLYANEQERKETVAQLKGAEAEEKQLKKDLSKKEKELRDFIRAGSDNHSGCRDLEDKIASNMTELSQKRMELIPLEAEVSQIGKRAQEYGSRVEVLSEERARQELDTEETASQLKKIDKAYENYRKKQVSAAAKNSEANLPPEVSEEYSQLREQFLMKGGHIESKLADLVDEMESVDVRKEDYKSKHNLFESRLQQLEVTRSDLKAKYSDVKSQIGRVSSGISSKKRELNSLKATRDTIQQEEFETKSSLKQVLLRLNDLGSLKRESSREKRLRENISSLKRLFPGVKGLVSDICKPKQKRYDVAVSTVMGKNFDAIVVSNLSVASECIAYLKEQRAGSALFIPLDTVSVKPVSQQYRVIASTVRPAIDVVEYAPEYEKAVQYACGDSLVCDSMDIAKAVRWERNIDVKVVTLDGSTISKSGLMTGGQTGNPKERWDKAELNSLLGKKEDLKSKLSELEKKSPSELKDRSLIADIERLETELPPLREQKQDLSKALQDNDSEIRNQQRLERELSSEEAQYESETVKPLQSKIEQSKAELKLVQGTIYQDFCNAHGFADIEEYERRYGVRQREGIREEANFQKEVQRLQSRLQFERERLEEYDDRLAKLKTDQKRFEDSAEQSEKRKKMLAADVDRLESELEVLQEELEDLRSTMRETNDESNELKTSVHDLKLEINSVAKKSLGLQETLEKLKIDKLGILRNCKMESVELPLKNGSLGEVPLEEGIDADSMDVEEDNDEDSVGTKMANIEVDFKPLPKKYRQRPAEDRIKEIDDSVAELKHELDGMSPNTKARDRLEDAERRLAAADEEFNRCKEQEREVTSEFEEVRKKRYETFVKAFEHISSQIDPIYKELTKSRVSPLGGSAYLTIEDEDEPYLMGIRYHAMPPMKRFRDMDQLSGGEKTVAALALLFAVHSFHPSPFFVLDEVDAALDNANVGRVARYINEHAGPNFQFIVISLKNQLFERSDALVGIYREHEVNTSKTLTLDLRQYPVA